MSHSPTRTNPELRVLGRFLVGLLALICIVTVCAVLTGCAGATGLVTARVKITQGSNVVEVVQPKDTTIDKLTIDPRTGAFTLQGYASAGNAEAIAAGRAQAEAQSAMWAQTIGFLREAGGAMAAAYGVPTGKLAAPAPAAADATTCSVPLPPAGMKWVLGPAGQPVLAPKDDPSTPQPAIP